MLHNSDISSEVVNQFREGLKEFTPALQTSRKAAHQGTALLTKFEMLRQYDAVFVHEVTEVKNKHGNFIVMLVKKHLRILKKVGGTRSRHLAPKEIEEYEPVLVFNLLVDMGKIFIKEETLAEKILDVLTRIDIDFKEFPRFSKNYYMAAEQPDLVRKHFPKRLLAALNDTSDMNVEINGTSGLLRPQKNFSKEVLHSILKVASAE
ncbi:MAG: hypothetical protein WDO14_06150 [Bacteroidota bacterium]